MRSVGGGAKGKAMAAALDYASVMSQLSVIHAAKARGKHPLWQGILAGKFSRPQIAEFLRQFSVVPLYNHLYHGPLYVVCPDAEWRSRMAEVAYEEATGRLFAGGVPHYQLYLRLGEAFGIGRTAMYEVDFCAEAVAWRSYYEAVCQRSFIEGVSATMLGGEAQVPGIAGRLSTAFITKYGLTPEQAAFHTVHEEADSDHAKAGREFLELFAQTNADLALVVRTVREAIDVCWLLYDGIYHRIEGIA
jgi:pyrroloquinoline quinone (PQQ) biosynthesis protein C